MDPRTSKPTASLPTTLPGAVTANSGARAAAFAFLSPPQSLNEIGRLAHYRVLAELGRGGMGIVFLAEETDLKRQVALKVMAPDAAAEPRAVARFRREAEAQAKVQHDHIITIYRVDEANGVPFIAMPLLRGQTLSAALKLNPRPPLSELVRIGREIAEGLAAAHEKGLVHRDIKPGNVWLEAPKRRVKILDFGLARTTTATPTLPDFSAPESAPRGDELVTTSGAVMGTPAYMSPEQARGLPTDRRSDLFSLGAVLYQMTTGQKPFTGASTYDVMTAVTAHVPPAVHELVPDVPAALSELIWRLMSKNPAERPPSAAAVAEELAAIERGLVPLPVVVALSRVPGEPDPWANIDTADDASRTEVVRTGTEEPAHREPTPKWPWLATAAALLVTGVVGFVIWKNASKPKTEVVADPPLQPLVQPKKESPPVQNDQRAVAEWVLKQQGGQKPTSVLVLRSGADKSEQVFDTMKLPSGAFTVTGACLETILPAHIDELPKMFGLLGNLDLLQFNGSTWTDDRLATALGALKGKSVQKLEILNAKDSLTKTVTALRGLSSVKTLTLTTAAEDGVPLPQACGLPGVNVLKVGTELTDQSLAPLANLLKFPDHIDLSGNPNLDDAGLAHLGANPAHARSRIDIHLNGTAVTEKGVGALAERMPESKIIWDGGQVGPKGRARRGAAAKVILDRGGEITLAKGTTVKKPEEVEGQVIGYLRLRSGTFPNPGPVKADSLNWDSPSTITMRGPFSDTDLGALRDLDRQVERLILVGQQFSDKGYGELLAYPHVANLRVLHLTNCELGDAAVPAIADRQSLLELHLVGTKVTDEGVKRLAGRLPALIALRFTDTPITDRSIPTLSTFLALISLDLKGTGITAAGAKRLAEALPSTLIRAPDGTVIPPTRKRLTRDEAVAKLFGRGAQVMIGGTPIETPARFGKAVNQVSFRLASGPYNAVATPSSGWDAPAMGPVAEPFDDTELVLLLVDLKLTDLRYVRLHGQKLTDAGMALFLAQPAARATRELDLTNSDLGDETAASAAALPFLEWVTLSDTKVTDAGVKRIVAARPALNQLRVANTAVTDDVILDLAKLFAADNIDLKGTKVTEAGAKRLAAALPYAFVRYGAGKVLAPKKLPTREETAAAFVARGGELLVNGSALKTPAAVVANTDPVFLRLVSGSHPALAPPEEHWEGRAVNTVPDPFSDAELCHAINGLKISKLTRIYLVGQKVTDAGIAFLTASPAAQRFEAIEAAHCAVGDETARLVSTLPELRMLYLNGTKVTDAGVRHLVARADVLVGLRLADTAVTDAALPDLKKFTRVTALDLKGTKVTEAGAKELAAALPKCWIRYGDGKELAPK
jgi:serine/threonine protein kinase